VSVTVYGSSDDLIEVDGDINAEFYAGVGDDGDLLVFSDGTIVRITYTEAGVWRIAAVTQQSPGSLVQAPEDDDDNYSDRLTIDADNIRWVALASKVEFR
jgi:hypothetical protein